MILNEGNWRQGTAQIVPRFTFRWYYDRVVIVSLSINGYDDYILAMDMAKDKIRRLSSNGSFFRRVSFTATVVLHARRDTRGFYG